MAQQTLRPWTPGEEKIGTPGVKLMSRINIWLFRASGGRLGNRFFGGAPVLLLTSIGRRSGRPRTAPLIYLEDGDNVVLVASKGGMSQHPVWYLNLVAHPDVEVQIGSEVRKLRARTASDEEKTKLWPRLNAVYAHYDDYQARTDRNIPVVICEPR